MYIKQISWNFYADKVARKIKKNESKVISLILQIIPLNNSLMGIRHICKKFEK